MEFRSPEWAAALEEAAAGDPTVAAAVAGHRVVLAQEVVDADGTTSWHWLALRDGRVLVGLGEPERADVTFRLDRASTRAVHDGHLDAVRALQEGRLTVRGDVGALTAVASALAALAGPWDAVRRRTA